jgi:uncharacterized membrane protein
MAKIETQIVINAPVSKVWAILTDSAAMPAWNPFIRSISGSPSPGGRLSVQIALPGQSAMEFNPTVLVASPDRELRWRGTVMGRWIFAGEHYFVLDQAGRAFGATYHGRLGVGGDEARLRRDE